MNRRAGTAPAVSTTLLIQNALSILIVAILTATLVSVRWILSTPIVVLLYLLAVLVNTTQWGLSAGIISSVCSFLAFNYFFLQPTYTLIVHQSRDILVLFVFLVVTVVTSQLVGRVRSALAEVQAREQDLSRLYDLSRTLTSLRGEGNIARILAKRLLENFAAQAVSVRVQGGEPTEALAETAGLSAPRGQPTEIVFLSSSGAPFGEIAVWRDDPFSAKERQVLRTFADQGTLALERALLADAETRTRVLEESDRLKSALLSSVSHELRTPLVTIKAAVTSLRSDEVSLSSQAREELLAALEEETDQLNQLVANLLNMFRLEAGALKLQRQWDSLAEIVDATAARLASITYQHRLEVAVPDDLPLVPVDASLINQVFANLISNGVKYAPPGTTIRISAAEQGEATLLVQVSNEGPPVPPEHLERIFEKFHRVTEVEHVPGIGLGLSICKGIVEAHGGRIWVENQDGEVVFNFTLPLTRDGASPPRLDGELEPA
jgi:two-component system sensor histidine kinase KdpD